MNKYAVKLAPYVYAVMRIIVGLMFALHGSQKWFNFPPSEQSMPWSALIATAGTIELVCGLLIAVGFFGRPAAFLASGQMAVAYFMAHFPKIFKSLVYFFPILNGGNGGEPAILYCFIFLYIAMLGSGIWSVDDMLVISKTKTA